MDILTLSFYGIICGTLAYASPAMKNTIVRLAIGVGTGLLAAAMLPSIKAFLL